MVMELGTVVLSEEEVKGVDYLRSLVRFQTNEDKKYSLQADEVWGRITKPFEELLLFLKTQEDYRVMEDYKLVFETLC